MASGNQLGLSIANTDTPHQEADMSSSWPSARASLDDSLVLPFESVEQLRAAKLIDIEEILEQLETAAESAESLRALVSTELPEASWQSREELDALLQEVQKREEARSSEQPQSPPLTFETALVPDTVVPNGSTLTAVEYTAQTSDELVANNPLIYGNTFTNVSMLAPHPDTDTFQSGQRRVTSWITAVGALVAAVAVLCFGISFERQLGKLHTQLIESSEASTRILQEGMRTDQRAWVGLTEATVHPLTANGGGFTIKLQNTGKTPALDLQVADVATIEDNDQSGPQQEPNVTASAGTLMPGAVYTTDVWFTTSPDAVSGLTRDRLRAANYVYVTYKDVFQKTHATKACFYWRKSMARVKPCDSYNELN